MTAAAVERARLAGMAQAVRTRSGRRQQTTPSAWNDLREVPGWLAAPVSERDDLARRVALLAMADTLAGSIDGAWLGALVTAAGEEAVDRAIRVAGTLPFPATAHEAAEALVPCGYAILAALLPEGLRGYLPGAPAPSLSGEHAAALLAMAEER